MNIDNLPLVGFEYPDSDTNYLIQRRVRVVEMDDDYVKGYEVSRNFVNQKPTFKKYSLGKIVQHGVHLIEFSTD